MKHITNAIASVVEKYALPISSIPAPIANGINSRKENFVALSLGIPANNAEEIVIPDREIPGKSATIWKRPMISAFLALSGCNLLAKRVKNNIVPVKIKAIPITSNDERVCSIRSLKKRPKMTAGIVAMIMYRASFFSFSVMMS